jgi:transforming growth factor-beta-induced protein
MPEPTEEPEPELLDIVDTAVADGRFTTLVAAVEAAGLVDALKGEGPLTVFAPTDDAFAALPEGTVEALLADIPTLTDILLYHVVEGKVSAEQVVELTQAMTLQGQYLDIQVMDGKVMIDNAEVIITDIETSNGIIHVIDAVLLPESRDIVDIAVEDGRFTTLVAALQAAGLVEALQGDGPFTVFAPTDDAFAALPEGTVEALLADIPALTDVLLYHVVEGKVMAADVVELNTALTLEGQYLDIQVMDGKVMIDNAEVIITDIEASNGVIHVVDTVLLPESRDIVDIAVEDGRFTTLVAALQAAGLVEALQGDGPFTVFAPTDDAFAALPEGTVEALLADIPALTDVLLYHVVEGKVMAADVVELSSASTLLGQDISISVMDGKVMVNESQVIITDIEASNGVIHVIDAVLLPQ